MSFKVGDVRLGVTKNTEALTARFDKYSNNATISDIVKIRGVYVTKHYRGLKTKIVAGSGMPPCALVATASGVRSNMKKVGSGNKNHKHDRSHAMQRSQADTVDRNLSVWRQIEDLKECHRLAHTRRLKDRIYKEIRALERL